MLEKNGKLKERLGNCAQIAVYPGLLWWGLVRRQDSSSIDMSFLRIIGLAATPVLIPGNLVTMTMAIVGAAGVCIYTPMEYAYKKYKSYSPEQGRDETGNKTRELFSQNSRVTSPKPEEQFHLLDVLRKGLDQEEAERKEEQISEYSMRK